MVPSLLQRVRVQGREGVYLAFRIDLTAETADLVPLTSRDVVERGMPFEMLEPEGEAATNE
jgi:hypothetical protein